MWRKAKIIQADNPQVRGKEVWVQGLPFVSVCLDRFYHRLPAAEVMYINLLDARGRQCVASLKSLELLGGPDAFCEDPPAIPFDEWARPKVGER